MATGYSYYALSGVDTFVDTNIFIYAQDASHPKKREQALDLLQRLSSQGRILISTQVLQEFAGVATRKLKLSLPETHALLDELAKLPVCTIDASTVKDAVTIHFAHQLSYFDSQVVACAAQNGCTYLYSEDMANGQTIKGVTIVNPFTDTVE